MLRRAAKTALMAIDSPTDRDVTSKQNSFVMTVGPNRPHFQGQGTKLSNDIIIIKLIKSNNKTLSLHLLFEIG